MDIIIAGAGVVGYELAKTLSQSHNVIAIDKDISKLNELDEDIDIMTIHGSIENPKTYLSLHLDSVDLFIAVTDSDKSNLLSTVIIEGIIKVKKKIIRLDNNDFLLGNTLERLSIDDAIFPNMVIAQKINSLLSFPKANNVKEFYLTDCKLVSIRIQYDFDITYNVDELNSDYMYVVAIERDRELFIPNLDDNIEQNDLIYLFGSNEQIENTLVLLDDKMPNKIKKVAIFGANELSQEIAKVLVACKIDVKMISKDTALCKSASKALEDRVSIINSSYEDHRFFDQEGIKNADMIIATEYNDEKNIVKCVEAKEHGIEKVVALNNDSAYYNLMHKLGVIALRGNNSETHYAIQELISSTHVVKQRHFCGDSGALYMRKIYQNSQLIGKNIKPLKNSNGILLLLIRSESIRQISEGMTIEQDDVFVLFGEIKNNKEMDKWIYSL